MEDPDLLDEAESLCRQAVDLAPHLPQAMNNLGNVLRARAGSRKPGRATSVPCNWIPAG